MKTIHCPVDVVVKNIVIRVGGREFDSRAGQIDMMSPTASLRCFFGAVLPKR